MLTDTTAKRSGRCAPVECCPDPKCECGLKNNFFEGKRLTPDMFRVEQRYLVERRRLLNRAIHGWGVVYGYHIESIAAPRHKAPSTRKLKIDAGLALDARGRELLQVGSREISFDDLMVIDADFRQVDRETAVSAAFWPGHSKTRGTVCWLLSAHYAEQHLHHVTIGDSCRCEHDEWDHTCETVRYSLQQIGCEDCCKGFDCDLKCKCGSGPCCNHDDGHPNDPKDPKQQAHGIRHQERPHPRGGCRCLCDYLTKLDPGSDCTDRLCDVEEECGHVRVDLAHGVPLACVVLIADECNDWTFTSSVEACGPRRLVKRNDLLFDLIRGCDLTRISDVSWQDWHRQQDVSFKDFKDKFGTERSEDEYRTNFYITFSRPVRLDTLRVDCFVMTIVTGERDDGWWETLRVPIVDLDTSDVPPDPDDPPEHVRSARLIVSKHWFKETVGGFSRVFDWPTRVEIEVRGDFIVDCNGQTVDANVHGKSAAVTGNGSPGGTFLSVFGVQENPDSRPSTTRRDPKGVSS
jgi:hypothetical protein